MMNQIREIDLIVERSLRQLAADNHVREWCAKENDWVNYFAHRHLLVQCSRRGPIKEPGQICIEVAVPQPPNREKYQKLSVRRDLVIWPRCGDAAFDTDYVPCKHPLAILEWTVYSGKTRKKKAVFEKERQWLRDYCRWQKSVLGYAILVEAESSPRRRLLCSRFLGHDQDRRWLELTLDPA